jgi:glycosyltransferase involved in cell wall biosynthesis
VRILIVAQIAPLLDGPGARPVLLHAQIEALRDRHEVTLVAGIGDEPWERSAAEATIAAGIDAHLADRRVSPRLRPRLRRRARLASDWLCTQRPWATHWFGTALQAQLDRLATTRTFDVVAIEDPTVAWLRFPRGVPMVLTDHDISRPHPPRWQADDPASLPRWALGELDWRRWQRFQPAAWRRARRIQVFSDYDAGAIAVTAPDLTSRVRVNPFGLVIPKAMDPARADPKMILFTGNFGHPPNRDAAVWLAREIMPRVWASRPEARLRVVGNAPPREVQELAGEAVEVIADVPDVDPFLEAASICAAPVRLGGGMRMKVLYALARGKPVVTTTRGAEGYRHAGRELPMIVADDDAGIAAGLVKLLSDDALRRDLGQRAHAFAEEFHSPSAWGARLERVYLEACSRSES